MAFILKYNTWKFIFAFLFNTVLCFICGLFFVWWCVVLVSFIVHFVFKIRPWLAFFSGFTSLFLLWTGLTLYISLYDHFYTSRLISRLFFSYPLPWVFNILTGMLAGFLGALSALSAAHARRIIEVKNFGAASFNSPVIAEEQKSVPVKENVRNPIPTQIYVSQEKKLHSPKNHLSDTSSPTESNVSEPFNNNSFIIK